MTIELVTGSAQAEKALKDMAEAARRIGDDRGPHAGLYTLFGSVLNTLAHQEREWLALRLGQADIMDRLDKLMDAFTQQIPEPRG